MKKLIIMMCVGIIGFSVSACANSSETHAPKATEPIYTTEIPTTMEKTTSENNESEDMKQELIDVMKVAYTGFTGTDSPVYLLESDDGARMIFVLESVIENNYIKFYGNAVVDQDGIITITDDENRYTLGFIKEEQEDGILYLNCGNIGECYLEQDKPSDVLDSIITVFNKKENVTVKLMKAILEMPDLQNEILNYLNNDLKELAQIDGAVMDGFYAVTGENYTDDQTMYDALKDEISPNLLDLIEKAESVELQTQELKDIHDIYLDSMYTKAEAFALMMEALEKSDVELVTSANEKIVKSNELESEYLSKLKAYANDNGVETTGF